MEFRPRRVARAARSGLFISLAAAAFSAIVGLPVVAIFLRAITSGTLAGVISRPIVLESLRLSLFTTSCSLALALLLGTPTAYLLARRRFPGHQLLESLMELPIVL